ncbi:MAG: 30S ribosomal protein S7 [Candidatus Marinimicrobia bacterium]|nr:30S ribosomal protein S7 [Candidatus Neomarinimicrobiota bacterium]MCH7858153.1 30S ribosomal protein S7 [Candidatus Neomarinimicrobiota bacterium]
MSRRHRAERRQILPDPLYGDLVVAKFINNLMMKGKKSIAESLFYRAMDTIKVKAKTEGIEIFKAALENVGPRLEVKSKRIGGSTYQVPIEVSSLRRQALAMRWLIQYARQRGGRTMADRLAAELIAAANEDGGAFKKRGDTHRMAEANKAFAHFR